MCIRDRDDVAQGGLPSLPPVVLKAVVVFAALVVLWLLIRAFIRWRYKARRRKRLRQVEERERRAAEKKAAQRPPVIPVSYTHLSPDWPSFLHVSGAPG